ncbi:MATE family efflux transporter [Kaistia geumhonensis]|uniref:Multidrug-efflux transporter n=1 Tax=Kaistia geumhonensis TaxID=410839 RepID=A0ABU0M3E9_9HYPH|nr:MATE family efflux transporter [Kaistia geumhonensis]MCX5479308.1 MATE family efflux transporter [Kaistia geumhonensis]MDQ0515470.1 MATE family multidrug resistance protein [Kaistia geumhonensis]
MTAPTATFARQNLLRPWIDEARATIALALPLILTNLAQTVINVTDIVFIGWLGSRELAAGALGTNLYFAMLIFGIGMISAVSPMIARKRGEKRHSVRAVRDIVRQGFWMALAITVPFWLLLWNAEPILLAIGQEPDLAREASHYMRGLQWAMLPMLLYLVLRSFVVALERPAWSLVIGVAGLLVNALAVWALVFGELGLPRLGILGAGIGSTISALTMFAGMAVVCVVHPRFRRYRIFGHFWRFDFAKFRSLVALGLPIGVAVALEATVFNAAVFVMGLIGADSVAAHAIAIQFAAVCFMVPLGFSQAATVRVGYAFGAGNREAITRAGWTPFALGTAFMCCTALLIFSVPEVLAGIFIDRHDPANAGVMALAVSFLGIAALFQVFDGAQVMAAGMLRGLHDARVPMIYAAVGYWCIGLGIGLSLAFGFGFAGLGIWIGLLSGLAATSVMLVGRWMRRDRLLRGLPA